MGFRRTANASILGMEHKGEHLAPIPVFRDRVFKYFLIAMSILIFSLVIGTVGYKYLALLSWVDAFLNASMILTGMGPTSPMPNDASKIFASLYAIYSGVTFLTIMAVFFAPIIHRFFHLLHIEVDDNDGK